MSQAPDVRATGTASPRRRVTTRSEMASSAGAGREALFAAVAVAAAPCGSPLALSLGNSREIH